MKTKKYFDTKYDEDGGIFWQNEYGKLRFAGKPKIVLKEIFNIRMKEFGESEELALQNAKEIFKFILQVFDNVGKTIDPKLKKPLSPFVFYPNMRPDTPNVLDCKK